MAVEKRTYKTGRERFRAYWRNPLTNRIERGPWGEEEDARKLSDHMKFNIKYDKQSFAVKVPAPSSAPFVSDILESYLLGADMTESTRKTTFYHMKGLVPLFENILVENLSSADLSRAERTLRAQGKKQNGIHRKMSIVLSALTWAFQNSLLEKIPVSPHEYHCAPGHDKRTPPPTPEQIAVIYEAAPEHLKRVIVLGYCTGARAGQSELLRIQWEDVYFSEGFVRIHSAAKNKKMQWRDIPISDPNIWALLDLWRNNDLSIGCPFVIHFRGAPITKFNHAWKRLFEKVNTRRNKDRIPPIPYYRPYDLRHAFVTEILNNGASLKAASELAGHADTVITTKTYQHTGNKELLDASKKLTRLNGDTLFSHN